MKTRGGKAIYGASVGILMLEARFPRIPGDMGNAKSWDFPVHYKIVRGASPDRIVRRGAEGMLPTFLEAAREMAADGVDGITTNCGFLSLFQQELAAAVDVPVATSSLMQVTMINSILPKGRRCGILTISGSTLTAAHLAAAHVPEGTPIGSTEGGREFSRVILNDEHSMDIELAQQDNVAAAQTLVSSNTDLGAILLECTNMTPYAADISHAVGLPVFTAHGFVSWFQSGLAPRRF